MPDKTYLPPPLTHRELARRSAIRADGKPKRATASLLDISLDGVRDPRLVRKDGRLRVVASVDGNGIPARTAVSAHSRDAPQSKEPRPAAARAGRFVGIVLRALPPHSRRSSANPPISSGVGRGKGVSSRRFNLRQRRSRSVRRPLVPVADDRQSPDRREVGVWDDDRSSSRPDRQAT